MHISDFLGFLWCYSRKSLPADSEDATRASRGHSSSAGSSQNLGTSHQVSTGRLSYDRAPHDPAGQLAHAPVIREHSNPTLVPIPHGSTARLPVHPSPPPNLDRSEHCAAFTGPQHLQLPVANPQVSSLTQLPTQPQDGNSTTLYDIRSVRDSRNVYVDGNMNTVTYTNTVAGSSNNFMKELLEKTIPGAAFDSSARDPPPRCHPGTRLAVLKRCLHFIVNCSGSKKMRWVFGVAGVGKSAIMQSIAESPLSSVTLRASIFFFVDGRSDGTKAIVTLAYQLAAKCESYRQFIEHEIACDPSLLQSSMSAQFNKFMIEPFVHRPQVNFVGRVLIIIDGLDECHQSRTQRELLRLISDFCLTYPSSPVVWMIASRPEPHIKSFFAQLSVDTAYEQEEILIDSDEAREDVETFLRIEFRKIQSEFLLNSGVPWPSEKNFWKLASASGGLFVYAHTAVRYIGNPDIGDPTEQLNDVLRVIDAHPLPNVSREEHPMALLDALYSRIMSKVPAKVANNTRKILLALIVGWIPNFDGVGRNFVVLCNWLGLTCDEAYAALRHLSSVLNVPEHDKAHKEQLRNLHKSFIDYLSDFSRSSFSRDIKHEAHQLYVRCVFRILEQAPDGIDVGDLDYGVHAGFTIGTLLRGPGTGDNILLSWRVGEESHWDNNKTRLYMYKLAICFVASGISKREQALCTVFCLRLLTTRFRSFYELGDPNLHEVVFDKSRHQEFMEQGLIRQIPIKMLNFPTLVWGIQLHFRRPTTPVLNLSHPWNPSCKHKRKGEWGEGKDQAWSTRLTMPGRVGNKCDFCCQRLKLQLQDWKVRCPKHPVSVLFTSGGITLVEFQFIDPEDDMSEWTYWYEDRFEDEKRKKLGSSV